MSSSALSSVNAVNAAEANRKLAVKMADWSSLSDDHPLGQLAKELPTILEAADYKEMYGVELQTVSEGKQAPHTTLVILQKYLRANAGDVDKAKSQLTEALKWRKSYNPLAAKEETFDSKKFGDLGYITRVQGASETKNDKDVAAFNIYGAAAKTPKETFGDTDAFIRWRVALMELTIAELKLNEADKPIPDYGQGPDPYQAIQVHDYLSVSFFRQPAEIKTASQRAIKLFSDYYPETVSFKYFVNVPLVMQWMMGAMKALISKDTFQKMTWMTYGTELHKYLGPNVPKEYGGSGPELKAAALTPKYSVVSNSTNGTKPTPEDKIDSNQDSSAAYAPAVNGHTESKKEATTPASAPVEEAQPVTDGTPEVKTT